MIEWEMRECRECHAPVAWPPDEGRPVLCVPCWDALVEWDPPDWAIIPEWSQEWSRNPGN